MKNTMKFKTCGLAFRVKFVARIITVLRHLMSRNFSAPKSAPKPPSVTTYSPTDKAILVANTEEHLRH